METASYITALSCTVKNSQAPTIQKDEGPKGKNLVKNLAQKAPNCLSKIPEVTEDYDLQGKTIRCQNRLKVCREQSSNDGQTDDRNRKSSNLMNRFISNLFIKSINCLTFTYKKIYSQISSQEINVAESQITEMLSKLRKKKQRKMSLLPQPQLEGKKTLVLDLDQTLISINFKKPPVYDYQIEIDRKGTKVFMYITKRFGLQSFLYQMSQIYEIVIFSSLKCELVEQIVSLIDPKKYIFQSLSRQHCIVINQCYFIKPVRDLGRNPKKVIVVDTHSISGSLNPQNLYKIDRFKGSPKDRKLIKLGYFLKHIAELNQIVPVNLLRKQFESKQILIYEKENVEKCMRRKKSQQPENISSNSGQRSVEVFAK